MASDAAEIEKVEEESIRHRWGSKLSAQDRVLHDYRRFTSIYLKKERGNQEIDSSFSTSEYCNDRFVFPADSELLMKYART